MTADIALRHKDAAMAGDWKMVGKHTAVAIVAIILAISQISGSLARTADFQYYTLEVPDDWQNMGPGAGPMRSLDGKLQIRPHGITVLSGAQPNADGSPDMDAIFRVVGNLKKLLAENPDRLGLPMIRDFATEDLGESRSMMRAVFRVNESMIVVLYYLIGPTYVVPFSVASKYDIKATTAKLDPILASLKWIGKPN